VWRQRLALKSANASLRLIGRNEDEGQLRDAHLLRRPGDDPGPSGRNLLAWRLLGSRSPDQSTDMIERVANLIGMARIGQDAVELLAIVSQATGSQRPAIIAVAELIERMVAITPAAEGLALWLADSVLAQKLKWIVPVPLLAGALLGPTSRVGGTGRRRRPGGEGFQLAVCLAYAGAAAEAVDLAGDLARKAQSLQAAIPRLRAKGAAAVVAGLLDDDALAGSAEFGGMSDRGLRRLFDRLVALGVVRELSGRTTFRLYGL
jgi:hypothetical protein